MEKSACVYLLLLIWTLFSCFISESSAKQDLQWSSNNEEEIENKPLRCYKCNSAYDPNCGDPFNPYTIGSVDCSLVPKPEHLGPNITASICRKTVIKANGKLRIARDCGYLKDNRELSKLCSKRTGTHDVQVLYCACEESLCNGGHFVRSSHLSFIWLPLFVLATTHQYLIA